MGGIWERVIRSLRRVLLAITDRQTLTGDLLSTWFSEAEYVVNSRLLTPVVLDASGDEPLTRSGDHAVGKLLQWTITYESDGDKCNISRTTSGCDGEENICKRDKSGRECNQTLR